MAWVYLLVAATFEVVWALALKATEGFTRLGPSVLTLSAMALSAIFLALAARTLPIGTAYAVWTGIGAALTALGGMALYGESRDPLRLLCIAVIVAGVAGLKAIEAPPSPDGALRSADRRPEGAAPTPPDPR